MVFFGLAIIVDDPATWAHHSCPLSVPLWQSRRHPLSPRHGRHPLSFLPWAGCQTVDLVTLGVRQESRITLRLEHPWLARLRLGDKTHSVPYIMFPSCFIVFLYMVHVCWYDERTQCAVSKTSTTLYLDNLTLIGERQCSNNKRTPCVQYVHFLGYTRAQYGHRAAF